MSFEITPSAGQLRELLPEVAAHMEEDFVVNQLRELGIIFNKRRLKGELIIEIPLSLNFLMRIRAVDVGPGGRKEFITFVRVQQTRMSEKVNQPTIKETIRAHVEITSCGIDDVFNTFSYTIHEDCVEDLIRSAIEGAYQTRNLMLKPLEKKSSRKLGRNNPAHNPKRQADE